MARFAIPEYLDIEDTTEVPLLAFAEGGIERVRFHLEGAVVEVTTPTRVTSFAGRPFEAYVVTLAKERFPARDGSVHLYAEVIPNDSSMRSRVMRLPLHINFRKTLPGSNVQAFIDSRATLPLANPTEFSDGNRLIGTTSTTQAIVVASATGNGVIVSPMSLDGGITKPQFTVGETVIEVLPNGTPTGRSNTVTGALLYRGTSGSLGAVGTAQNPFWHLRAAAAAIQAAGVSPIKRVRYLFTDGSYHLYFPYSGELGKYEYVHFQAAPGANPTLDFSLANPMYLSYVDQHINGFTFRTPHVFSNSFGGVNIGAGPDNERYWLNNVRFVGKGPNQPVMGYPGNGGTYFFTDVEIETAAIGLGGSLLRNVTVRNSSNDAFSQSTALINLTTEDMEQIYPSHTDIYQFEVGAPAENLLIYGLKVVDPVVINAGLFLTGEGGARQGSFRDVAIINYLGEQWRDDINNNVDHVLVWHATMPNSNLGVGLGAAPQPPRVSFFGNWFKNFMLVSPTTPASYFGTAALAHNNFGPGSSQSGRGTSPTSLSAVQSFVAPGEDYTPLPAMPRVPRRVLLDVEGNYRDTVTAIGALAGPEECLD